MSNSHSVSSPGLTGRSSIPETPRLEPRSRGVLDGPVKPGHDSGEDQRKHSRGTFVPEFCVISRPRKSEGAGNAGARTHPRLCVQMGRKKRTQVITGTPKHPAFPARWFTAYGALSPGCRLDSPRPPGLLNPELDLSVGRPGPHAFARPLMASLVSRRRLRPSHSAPRFVTIGRNVPLDEAGCAMKIIFSDFQQSVYFRDELLKTRNALDSLANSVFSHGNLTGRERPGASSI
jgi:hypothetical protein